MPNLLNIERPRPTLKPKPPSQLSLLPTPAPPTQHREPPANIRDRMPPTARKVGGILSLTQSVDYDKLTPTQQLKWDNGMYGSIQLKTVKGHQYYYLRWTEVTTKIRRSKYLGKTWDLAIAELKRLTGHSD